MSDNKSGYEIRLELIKEAISIVKDQWYSKKDSLVTSSQNDGKYDYKELGDIPINDALTIANKLYSDFVNKK